MFAAAWAAPALANRVPTDPEPDIACHPDAGTGWLTSYATTVQTPADSTDWSVSVEFTIAGEGASCELSLATYELPSQEFSYPQSLFDSDSGTFGPGTYTLTAALPLDGTHPGCHAQYDFVFGPAISELTFENRYGERQIRARIVGSDECPQDEGPSASASVPASASASASASVPADPSEDASPSATGGIEGGNPTPQPNLPDTRMSATSTGSAAAGLLAAVLLLSLTATGAVAMRSRMHR
jgi:hypothetical protein